MKLLAALAGAAFLGIGTANAFPFCAVEGARKQGDSVDVRLSLEQQQLWMMVVRDGVYESYRWESGKLYRRPKTGDSEQVEAALLLKLGHSVRYDFGSHHSGCTLTAVEEGGKLALQMHSWTYVPGVDPQNRYETMALTD